MFLEFRLRNRHSMDIVVCVVDGASTPVDQHGPEMTLLSCSPLMQADGCKHKRVACGRHAATVGEHRYVENSLTLNWVMTLAAIR